MPREIINKIEYSVQLANSLIVLRGNDEQSVRVAQSIQKVKHA